MHFFQLSIFYKTSKSLAAELNVKIILTTTEAVYLPFQKLFRALKGYRQ